MLDYKLGKTPARPESITFKLRNYLPVLPTPPVVFGHSDLVSDYGMLGNDRYGCCVWAGAAHETMLWTREGSPADANFTQASVLSDYSAVTGFDPSNPSTDQGTDMQVAASYRRKIGIKDAHGRRHKVLAYVAIDIDDIPTATWLFGAIGIGIQFPASAEDQFSEGIPWSIVNGSSILGGHYVPLVGRIDNGNYLCVTWGKLQQVTPQFIQKYCDETVAYLSKEFLVKSKTLEGFNLSALEAGLSALSS